LTQIPYPHLSVFGKQITRSVVLAVMGSSRADQLTFNNGTNILGVGPGIFLFYILSRCFYSELKYCIEEGKRKLQSDTLLA
jgi:hypothetical protein